MNPFLKLSLLIALAVGTFTGFAPEARAYPELIRLGYVQCQACHTSSLGGGLLNAYGKSVRTSLSVYQRRAEMKSEEGTYQELVNANVFGRYLWIDSANYKDRFLMQLDAAARADFKNGFGVETIIGLQPDRVRSRPDAPSGLLGKSFIARRLLIDKKLGTDGPLLVVGRDFLPRSTNTDDHTTWLRSLDRQNYSDLATEVRLEFSGEKDQTHLGVYAPSFEENRNNREYGLFARYEHALTERWSLGAEGIGGQTDAIRRESGDLFSRYGYNEKLGAMLDLQWVQRQQRIPNGANFGQAVIFWEPFYAPTEWTLVRYRIEKLYREGPFNDTAFRHALTLNVKLVSEITLMGTVEKTYRAGQWSGALYSFQLFAQL